MAITYHAGRRIQGLALTESDTTLDSTAGNNDWNTVYSSNGSTMTHYGGEHFTATKWRNLELKTFVIKYGKYSASSTGSHYLKVYGSDHTTQIGSTITGTPNVSSTATTGAGGTDVTFDLTGITSPNTEWFIGCGTSATGSAPTNIRINTSSAGDGSNYWREYNGYNDYTSQSASFTLVYAGVSGDVKPTNVQVGSRFEETDTRKMYHYNQVTEVQQLVNDSGQSVMGNGNESDAGINIKAGSALIGVSLAKVSFLLKQEVNPATENLVYCRLYRSGTFVHTFGTTDPDNITVGSYSWYSFGTGGDADAGNGSVTLQQGDRILVSWDRGGAYNDTAMYMAISTTSTYDGTATNFIKLQGSTWTEYDARDACFKLVGLFPASWSEEGT